MDINDWANQFVEDIENGSDSARSAALMKIYEKLIEEGFPLRFALANRYGRQRGQGVIDEEDAAQHIAEVLPEVLATWEPSRAPLLSGIWLQLRRKVQEFDHRTTSGMSGSSWAARRAATVRRIVADAEAEGVTLSASEVVDIYNDGQTEKQRLRRKSNSMTEQELVSLSAMDRTHTGVYGRDGSMEFVSTSDLEDPAFANRVNMILGSLTPAHRAAFSLAHSLESIGSVPSSLYLSILDVNVHRLDELRAELGRAARSLPEGDRQSELAFLARVEMAAVALRPLLFGRISPRIAERRLTAAVRQCSGTGRAYRQVARRISMSGGERAVRKAVISRDLSGIQVAKWSSSQTARATMAAALHVSTREFSRLLAEAEAHFSAVAVEAYSETGMIHPAHEQTVSAATRSEMEAEAVGFGIDPAGMSYGKLNGLLTAQRVRSRAVAF
jgi:hypothetical protein